MRFHIRRLVFLALSSTFIIVIFFNVLRPHDVVDRALPQIEVEERPLHPLSLDERLAKYRPGGGGNVTIYEQPDRPDLVIAVKPRPPPRQSQQPESNQDEKKDDLMSESVSGSQNERIRRQYVHLPDESKNGVETLWWNGFDDDPNDRILAQMSHVPRNYHRDDQKLKVIYMPGGLGNVPEGQEKFTTEQCPVNACRLTSDRSVAQTASMRLLQADAFFDFDKKPAGQIWTMFLLESPANTDEFPNSANLINWTATYRWDSTMVTPYEKFVPYRNASVSRERPTRWHRRSTSTSYSELKTTRRNYAAGKTKMVAWFVSNCGPKNRRNEYANELAKYVQVDVYGGCGTLRCLRSEFDRCRQLLNNDYKFYLSFENSNCDYYITEKFYENGLRHDVVPIVMGGRKEDYKRSAPPHSYIHVEDFPSAKDLAKYLHRLDQSDELYNRYFAWKGTGEFINTKFWCRLCALLHDEDKPVMWYSDFEKWWSHTGACRLDRWDNSPERLGQ